MNHFNRPDFLFNNNAVLQSLLRPSCHKTPNSVNLYMHNRTSLGYRNRTVIKQQSLLVVAIDTLLASYCTASRFPRFPSNVLPSRSKPPTRAGKEAFLLVLLQILINLIRIQLGCSEEG